MTCQELDRFLYPYLDGEFQPEERMDVEAHLETCAECAGRVAAEQQIRQTLRRAARHSVQSARAPSSLRAGIQAGLQREQRRAQVGLWLRASAVALVMVTAGGTWVALHESERQRFVEDAVKRHTRGLPHEVASTTREAMEAWFNSKLDHRVSVPDLDNATVSGGRILHVNDHEAAYISYEAAPAEGAPPRKMGLFVFNDTGRNVKAQALPAVEVDSSQGYNVALWRDGEIVYELVTDLDEADIRKMIAQQARGERLASKPARPAQLKPDVAIQPASLEP
jgi:mycothiol system anti-sigma-R factor